MLDINQNIQLKRIAGLCIAVTEFPNGDKEDFVSKENLSEALHLCLEAVTEFYCGVDSVELNSDKEKDEWYWLKGKEWGELEKMREDKGND